MTPSLIFLKLGGSLITEKDKPATARLSVIHRLAEEISNSLKANPQMLLVLGHGSGSFGHVPAKKHNTRAGVKGDDQWAGFVEVWQQARVLNRIVMDALLEIGLRVISFPPSASIIAKNRQIVSWDIATLQAALGAGLLPVIYGDVAFDQELGGTILSTEDLFEHLAQRMQPKLILLAGDEEGIFEDYPQQKRLIAEITPVKYSKLAKAIGEAVATDVTGGMAGKVQIMLKVVESLPNCEVRIFSGLKAGNVQKALSGIPVGTTLKTT